MKILTALFFLIFAAFFYSASLQENWQLQKSRNNIKVYSRSLPGKDIRELKAVTTVNVPLSNIVAMIKEVDYYPKWVYRCSEAEIINKISETEFIYYQVIYVPWPLTNRDMIIHSKISQDVNSGEVTVKLDGVSDYIEKKNGLVRVPKFEGKWILTPLADGKINITHELFIEPNAEIPSWLVNYAAVEGPYSTLSNMVMHLRDKRFANKSFDFLKDSI